MIWDVAMDGTAYMQLLKGASHVVGIDLSEKMLQEAEKEGVRQNKYHRIGIEDYDYPSNRFDGSCQFTGFTLH